MRRQTRAQRVGASARPAMSGRWAAGRPHGLRPWDAGPAGCRRVARRVGGGVWPALSARGRSAAVLALLALSACTGSAATLELVAGQAGAPRETQTAGDDNTATLDPSSSAPPPPPTPPTPPPSVSPSMVVVGRVTWPVAGDAGHFISAWPGTSVGVRFRGTGLVARMADTDAAPLAVPSGGWGGVSNTWEVVIDGVAQPGYLVAGRQPGDVVVARDLVAGEHEVWLTRRTEAPRLGRVEFFGVRAVDGELLAPPAPRPRRIEAVGTSVETGLHVGASANDTNERWVTGCGFHWQGLNQNHAWPKLAAQMLDAELVNTSVEGVGLLLGFSSFAGAGVQMPGIYRRADLFVPTPPWDPTGEPVDVVLLAAGWSDVAQLDPTDPNNAIRLQTAYESFLAQTRAAQPGAMIYAVVRTSDGNWFHRPAMAGVIEAAVQSRQTASDSRVAVMSLPAWTASAANCDDHPNWAQQQALAVAASAIIRTDMRW